MKKLFSCVAAVLFAVSVSAAVDVLTADMLPATSTQTYVEFTGVTATSDAVYAGQTANKNGAIQMRSKNSNSGIVSTTSGGKVLTVSVEWDSETTSKRTVDIYGSNTPYSSAADLYNNSARGTKLGSIALEDETATITVEGDYYYVGLRSNDGALYLKSISIEWDGSDVPEPEEPEEPVEPAVIDTLTCAAAAEKALAGVTDSAVVIGYVTEIASAWTEKNGYLSFWMADSVGGGQVFEAYHAVCETAEDVPGVGDKVALKGKLGKYNTTAEMLAGCTYTILERSTVKPEEKGKVTIAEFLAAKDNFNIYTLTGTVSDIANIYYGNFNLTDSTGTIYVYGLLTADGVPEKFAEMGIEEDDVITVKGSYNEHNGEPQIKNAIFVSKSSGETALETVRTAESAEKRIVNGQLVIIRNGVMYNAAGTRME